MKKHVIFRKVRFSKSTFLMFCVCIRQEIIVLSSRILFVIYYLNENVINYNKHSCQYLCIFSTIIYGKENLPYLIPNLWHTLFSYHYFGKKNN